MQIEQNNSHGENQRLFLDYLGRQPHSTNQQFTLDIDQYRKQNTQAAQQIIKQPTKYYRLIKKHLQAQQKQHDTYKTKVQSKIQHYQIKIQGNLGANFVTPRGLNSRMANQLVGLQGIITKIDLPKNYLQKSVHYCEKTKAFEMRQYPDTFNPQKDIQQNFKRTIKQFDDSNNPLTFEYGFSSFKNMQMAVIQQLPQMAPPGLLPMSVQVVLQNKLVGSVKPGDRVQMIGIYKLITNATTKQKGIFRPYFLCLSVKPLNQVASMLKKPAKNDIPLNQMFEVLSKSVAPSLWGHEYLKKAVLLMLVGGVEKITPNNTHLRGDINILMVGDPGTAKSQMLRWILSTVDISIGTTGSGASGVGLTAAIVSDKVTGEKTLQAGAMVLADRGVVCIDQFDKMNQIDRVAVHQVMEQQTVTIAKAGLHCSLNARCAVIAAANPIYGQYQTNMPPTKNVGMPDSLLSRFDLIFIIRDQKTPQRDRQIAQKVCRNHRLAPQSNDFMNQYMDSTQFVVNPISDKKQDESIVYEKNNVYKSQDKGDIVAQTFLKRYINYVKLNFEPILTDDAVKLCAQLWAFLRQKDFNQRQTNHIKVLPVTIRTLQSIIRLSTAHAKVRQSLQVQSDDVIEAFRLMCYCNYGEQDKLQDDMREIIHKLQIPYKNHQMKKKKPRENILNNNVQPQRKIETQKKQTEQIKNKMSKMNLQRINQQIDPIIYKFTEKSKKQQEEALTIVYKAISDIKRKKKSFTKQQVYERIPELHPQIIDLKINQLEMKGKITTQGNKIFCF